MELRERIGKRIKELRVQANLKQHELAEMINISPKTQSCIETGKNFPKVEQLEGYAKAFNIDVAEILDIREITMSEDDYLYELNKLINKANAKQIELIYKYSKLVILH